VTVTQFFHQDNGSVENEILHGGPGLYKLQSAADAPAGPGKYERLSRALHISLPSREDTEMICKASGHGSIPFHEILTMPYTTLDRDGLKSPESLLETPGPNMHPVLIARHMLYLAVFLQHLHPDIHKEIKGLSESPRAMMTRLADTAISLITTNDELLGSIEGLECIMIESLYQANGGNLRRSWIAVRRAMVVAQLMGLHRSGSRAQYKMLDPKTKAHPQFMWFRIVFYDRHLCLMLGFPQGSLDRSMASHPMLVNDTPMGRLERIHCVLASRILERNESEPSSDDFALTQILDMELQRAARSLPSKWWLTPNLDSVVNDSQALFWDIRRLSEQLSHYYLLNQLHLPYMLRSSAERKYEYSRITCVNASREVLSRFIMLRSFNRIAFSCRTADFLALMAALTLLLAHLDSHRYSQAENLLAHQYLSDRAMMEQAQENMKEISRLNADVLSAQSAELLRRLLAIEAEATDGHTHSAESVSVQTPGTETAQPDDDNDSVVRVHIPYFGIIKIDREGVISEEMPKTQPPVASNSKNQPPLAGRSSTTSSETPHAEAAVRSYGFAGPSGTPNAGVRAPVEAGYDGVEELPTVPQAASDAYAEPQAQLGELSVPSTSDNGFATEFAPQFPSAIPDALLQQYPYPGLSAGVDDWAFQGVDMAFFDSLMRGTGDDGNGGAEWATWQNGP
jgi:hypothetical protein